MAYEKETEIYTVYKTFGLPVINLFFPYIDIAN